MTKFEMAMSWAALGGTFEVDTNAEAFALSQMFPNCTFRVP
jgi:hypothetical protein